MTLRWVSNNDMVWRSKFVRRTNQFLVADRMGLDDSIQLITDYFSVQYFYSLLAPPPPKRARINEALSLVIANFTLSLHVKFLRLVLLYTRLSGRTNSHATTTQKSGGKSHFLFPSSISFIMNLSPLPPKRLVRQNPHALCG